MYTESHIKLSFNIQQVNICDRMKNKNGKKKIYIYNQLPPSLNFARINLKITWYIF